ncbi:MAG TPA: cyclic pyranopterin monophosphate synthase MoaC [Gemmatimonas sp.]|nr:cyclic pyranopterin monophosphate synthase MoaC [Gemmatimonas sp.]
MTAAGEADTPGESTDGLSHVDATGNFRMVDVTAKPISHRIAIASGSILMEVATLKAIQNNALAKGDVIPVARLAGIHAAKRTADLIPLCHPLPLSSIDVRVIVDEALPGLRVDATVKTTAGTGVEMEALTAVSVALLAIYDMAKAVDKSMTITNIVLREKRGGTKGDIVEKA